MPYHGHHHQQIAEQRRGDDRAEDADLNDCRYVPVDLHRARLGVVGIRVLLGRGDVQQRCHVERGNLRRVERCFRGHARPTASRRH